MDMHTPGERLVALRLDAGYKTTRDFFYALRKIYMQVDYMRLYRLEQDKATPTPYERDAICKLLKCSTDCWERGVCKNPALDLANEINDLTERQISILLELQLHQIPFIKKNH